jgi:hypothetical protein
MACCKKGFANYWGAGGGSIKMFFYAGLSGTVVTVSNWPVNVADGMVDPSITI